MSKKFMLPESQTPCKGVQYYVTTFYNDRTDINNCTEKPKNTKSIKLKKRKEEIKSISEKASPDMESIIDKKCQELFSESFTTEIPKLIDTVSDSDSSDSDSCDDENKKSEPKTPSITHQINSELMISSDQIDMNISNSLDKLYDLDKPYNLDEPYKLDETNENISLQLLMAFNNLRCD